MAGTEQIIRLQGNEDIHALRTMISRAQGDRVLLVVPRGHEALRRTVRLKLLVRQAHDEGKSIALVTRDPDIHDLARDVNLSVFRTVSAGQRARRWDRGVESFAGSGGGNGHMQRIVEPRPLAWRTGRQGVLARREELGRGPGWAERIAFTGLGLGLLIVFVAILVLVVPGAQVVLSPQRAPHSVILDLVADPGIAAVDRQNLAVPAETVEVLLEGTLQAPTSGRKDVPDQRAVGTVLFVNLTAQDVTVPAGTIVGTRSAVPVKFRTLQPVTVPGGVDQRAVAPVEAVQPGLTGNVAALQINEIEGVAGVVLRVLNPDPLAGGSVRQAAIVTAADKEQLREQLASRLRQEALSELQNRTPDGMILLPETMAVEQVTENFDGQVDEQAEILTLLLRVRARALAVAQQDVERLARQALLERVPGGFVLLDEPVVVTPQRVEPADEGRARLAVQADGMVGASLNAAAVRALIRGRPVDEAVATLADRLPLSAAPQIVPSPAWWPRVPYLPLRITVRLASPQSPPG